jgi:hypothetical protein
MDATRETQACPVAPDPGRCSGTDPGFVFSPALACDPSAPGADAADGGSAGEGSADASDAGPDPCAGVTTLDVFFTPAACQAFARAEASGLVAGDTDPLAPGIDEPSNGDMLTPDNWAVFVWHRSTRDARRDPIQRALSLLEPSAYASSPLRGEAYVIEFTQGCTEVLRAMVVGGFWLPDPASWAILTALTGPVTVRVYWMQFAADALVSTPVSSAPITITMQGGGG